MEIGAPTGRWQLVVVYRGKHDPVCVTYLAALQVRAWRPAASIAKRPQLPRSLGAGLHGCGQAQHPPFAALVRSWSPSTACALTSLALCSDCHSLPKTRPQHLMPEFEELSCDVVAVSADTRGKACSFVSLQGGSHARLSGCYTSNTLGSRCVAR